MKKYILALDEGTTSVRSVLFDSELNCISVSQKEFTQIYPKPGYIEHNALEIFSAQYETMCDAVAKSGISPDEIAGIGITNQRETTVVWDKNTGMPIYNAIVWQCRRTADICEKLKADGLSDYVRETTGLVIDAYFSATKIKWILDNVDGAREKAERGDLLFGTIDTFLIWKLSNGKAHVTDYTNASRTMLFDINKLEFDKKLLDILQIPDSMMPEVKSSSEIYTEIDFMRVKIPVCGIAGDQQAALFGQGCFNKGDVKNTYGTGCFLLMNCGEEKVTSKNGLVTTLAATLKGENPNYALEGSVFVGGAVIQWLRDELGIIKTAAESEYFASLVENNGGVYLVPAFTGLGAPYWDMYARGTIVGLTRGSGKNHIIRAALESIAYQTNDLLRTVEKDISATVSSIKADGGACANSLLMQFQSDISNAEILIRESFESTALGAAALAGLASGVFKDKEQITSLLSVKKRYTPNMTYETREELLNGWKKAVKSASSTNEI